MKFIIMQHKTLSEIIKQKREELGLVRDEVAQVLKIPLRYLEYLENNKLQKMPDWVYTAGLLKKYSQILGLDSRRILRLYEHEFAGDQNNNSGQAIFPYYQRVKTVVTPKKIILLATLAAIFVIGGFWGKQVSLFFMKPSLAVSSPDDGAVASEHFIIVEGKTSNGVLIDINDQSVPVSEDGNFKKKVFLQSGLNTLAVTAKDFYGKKNTIVRAVSFNENRSLTAKSNDVKINNLSTFDLKIKAKERSSWITIVSGNENVYSGILLPGVVRFFKVQEGTVISAGQAGNLLISVNDDEFKAMGEKDETYKKFIVNKNSTGGI